MAVAVSPVRVPSSESAALAGVLTAQEKELAYSYAAAAAKRYVDFWMDPATGSVDMWSRGRRTDAYRGAFRRQARKDLRTGMRRQPARRAARIGDGPQITLRLEYDLMTVQRGIQVITGARSGCGRGGEHRQDHESRRDHRVNLPEIAGLHSGRPIRNIGLW